ncbi:hypothetical protein YB2330_005763 [Saitoella coloradoensis]
MATVHTKSPRMRPTIPKSPLLRPSNSAPPRLLRRSSSHGSSGSDEGEVDETVPECDITLDNEAPPYEFSFAVLSILHKLQVPIWRHLPHSAAKNITCTRISGALTNAVYLVKPPDNPVLPDHAFNPPPKLLLRVYGPRVAHLIDRPAELGMVARLSAQRIGPRLLGIFANGRFEQWLESEPLTKESMREPTTSEWIARRMKELHEGISLEQEEKAGGAAVWKNWDKWLAKAHEVIAQRRASSCPHITGRSGLIIGTKWEEFVGAVAKYREWLYSTSTDQTLVFAHNDTQYGNLLRLARPPSSALKPTRAHRQLVVIDFEYSGPSPRAYDVANHFCEWMADYHSSNPHFMDEKRYPMAEEQARFYKAYAEHMAPTPRLSEFSLDGLVDTTAKDTIIESQIEKLECEVKAWRAASHAQWAMWGVIQAVTETPATSSDPPHPEDGEWNDVHEVAEEEEFDYLAYADQRMRLFWGDMVELGLAEGGTYPWEVKKIMN